MHEKTSTRGALTAQPGSQYRMAARLRQALNTDGARWRARLPPSTWPAQLLPDTSGQREEGRDQRG